VYAPDQTQTVDIVGNEIFFLVELLVKRERKKNGTCALILNKSRNSQYGVT